MQDLQIEITRITRVRRLLDVVGIFAGLTALLFPSLYGILIHPTEANFTSLLIWNVSMGLLPVAFNLMVLSIALRLRARELKRIQQADESESAALLQSYLAKIDRHRIVLLTIGWLAVAKTVVETVFPVIAIVAVMTRVGEYSPIVFTQVLFQLGATIVQGLIFAVAQFGLARFLKGQGLRLAAPKAEITTN